MAEITTYQMLVNGQWVDASDGKRYDSIDPASGVVWATMAEATEEDVNRAVAAAVAAEAEAAEGERAAAQSPLASAGGGGGGGARVRRRGPALV